ncbi:sensor histidine kinase [Aurantiacibacter gangjinensis]|uniref:Uncharacterized protein n=1 Tax=Aurantiacibacter gangjinensis TaxID=502682 RepID=A0A0G9MLH5_9SPHN|nr:histidine kinase [Aurantiacibacter gangjinensis]APE27493.1 Autolysin sensor kinase [Aurantiacibacter gangjinensis]KLE31552.1 hypothetical protein AAW01_08295 [Aurantiacibacter gangjinensis]
MDKPQITEAPARVPFKTVLLSAIGLWATYLVLMTLRAYLLDMDMAWELFERRVIASCLGVVITLGLWLALRPFDTQPLWGKIAAALIFALPAALLSMQANRIVFAEMQAELTERQEEQTIEAANRLNGAVDGDVMEDIAQMVELSNRNQIIEIAFSRYFMMLAWCALYLAMLTGEKARTAERREQQFRSAAKAAELRSLRYQVNPHFLFNTLNSLSALVLTRKPEEAEKMIHMISTFYRRSLADDPTQDVPLCEEIAVQKLYLDIEAVRFPKRLVARYDVPQELCNAMIPGMILQPLIENSVKHGVAPSTEPVTITLSAREEYGRLVVTVSDNGKSEPDRDDIRPGYGIGLANVRERLEARFGNEATVVSGHVPDGYATHLRLPMQLLPERAKA